MHIGCKYRHPISKGIFTLIGQYNNVGWFLNPSNKVRHEWPITDHANKDWEWVEYREPVIQKIRRLVAPYSQQRDGYATVMPENATRFERDFSLGLVEFTITDGKLTGVEIVDSRRINPCSSNL